MAANTSRSDFRIRDLMHHADPVSLYIVTQPNDKERLRPLVRIVVNMAVRLLADKMELRKGPSKGDLQAQAPGDDRRVPGAW